MNIIRILRQYCKSTIFLSQMNLMNKLHALQAQVSQDRAQDELVILYGNRNLANTCLQNTAALLCTPYFGRFTSPAPQNTACRLLLCVQAPQGQQADQVSGVMLQISGI